MKKLWNIIKRAAPAPLRPLIYETGLKFYRPSVDESGAPPLKKPVVVVSADFELAWAWRYAESSLEFALEKARTERAQVPRIVKFLDEIRVPITWATVGHLALTGCERDARGRAHADIPALAPDKNPFWSFRGGDWFEFDPCRPAAQAPEWYAPDLIEGILKAKAGHEIGCHSFSHADSGSCSAEFFRAELEASERALQPFGVKPTSYVFPGNLPGHHDVLREKGYRMVRDFPWRPEGIDFARPREILPKLWGLHQSMLLESYGWDPQYLERKTLRLIDAVRETRSVLSLWFHPSLSDQDFTMTFQPVLRRCAELRDRGEIEIMTMDQLTRHLET